MNNQPPANNPANCWYIVNIEAAILDERGRYLVIVRSEQEGNAPGTLAFPGGKVEGLGSARSAFEATLRREIREEVGVEVGPELVYVESTAFTADDGDPIIDVLFLCRYAGGGTIAADPTEVAGILWLPPEEVLRHPKAPPWTRHSLEMAEKKRLELGWDIC